MEIIAESTHHEATRAVTDAEKPNEYSVKRNDLDTKRIAAIQKYLAATLTGRPATFDIQVHDPAYPGIDGAAPRVVTPSPQSRVQGTGAGSMTSAGGIARHSP